MGSAQALGFAVAPLLGGIVANQLGIDACFIIVGMMLVGVSVLTFFTVREPDVLQEDVDVPETSTAPAAR